VRLADVNGDGWPDLTTGWEESGHIRVYLHPGHALARETWPAVTVGQVASPEDAVFADLDGDSAVDVVSSCEGKTRTMHVHWAPQATSQRLRATAWQTQPFPATAGRQMWMFAVPMQVDGQNGIDLIVGSKGEGGSVSWLQSPANPRDVAGWRLHHLRDAGWIMSLLVRDLDGDGDLDVLFSDRKGPRRGVFWLEHPGTESVRRGMPWREHPIGALGEEVMFIDFADMNGDGRNDVLAAVQPRRIIILSQPLRPGEPWPTETITLPGDIGHAKAVRAADLDLDGQLDLVFSCEGADGAARGVAWYTASGPTGAETWTYHDLSGPEGTKFDLVELVDLDGDGDLDILTCEETENLGVIWYENPAHNPRITELLVPAIEGDWWPIARNPDLGDLTSPNQQPVDFAVWQAEDGTWQLWSCIRNTTESGHTRLFYRWEGPCLDEGPWKPMGIAQRADPTVGETPGGQQAPHVFRDGKLFRMFYGDWEQICMSTSRDGKQFTRITNSAGKTGMFGEGPNTNTRDPMVLRVGSKWICYYTAYPERRGAVFARTSMNLTNWSDMRIVNSGGRGGSGPFSAECPHVIQRNGHFYLFRTERYGRSNLTHVYRSTDPLDFGVGDDTKHWVTSLPVAAPEIIRHDGVDYLAALNLGLDGIRMARLKWVPSASAGGP
jgi:hypothetical protein